MARLLLVDDDLTDLCNIQTMCTGIGSETVTAGSLRKAFRILESDHTIDLVLASMVIHKKTAFDFLRIVLHSQRLKDIPIILYTSGEDKETLVEAMKAGARDILVKPFTRETLAGRLAKALQQGRKRILLVEDEIIILEMLKTVMEIEGFYVLAVRTAEEGLDRLAKDKVDIVVADIGLEDMTGLELTSMIKQRIPGIPVLLITGRSQKYTRNMTTSCEADGYISKPFHNTEIARKIRALLKTDHVTNPH